MSTGIALREQPSLPEAIERALVGGDLSSLTVDQRWILYKAKCAAAGLDPASRPFIYIEVYDSMLKRKKLILYAPKECAEMLNQIHGISHTPCGSSHDEKEGLYEVTVQATARDGRTNFDVGIVSTRKTDGEKLVGADLANARMKATTKAKRRVTLSICGLGGIVDESELDTMTVTRECTETGELKAIDNGSGYARGTYASPDKVDKWLVRARQFLDQRNQRWLDHWSMIFKGDIPKDIHELCRIFQLDNHLVKWAVKVGHLKQGSIAEDGLREHQLGKLTALLFFGKKSVQEDLIKECHRYVDDLERVALQAIAKNLKPCRHMTNGHRLKQHSILFADRRILKVSSIEEYAIHDRRFFKRYFTCDNRTRDRAESRKRCDRFPAR